jgi:hypothetical protein
MKTVITILLSITMGVGSTLLVQTIIVSPPAVMVVACPDPDVTLVEKVLTDKALEPLDVEQYVPQGQLHPMPTMTGRN